MTVKEAKERIEYLKMQLQEDLEMICFTGDELKALDMAIQALEELEQYRALGTVEELKEAREKQIPKKPIRKHINTIRDSYVCPTCGTEWLFGKTPKYCGICGQKLGEEGETSD